MEAHKLAIANNIKAELDRCELNLKNIRYTQHENVVERESYLSFRGSEQVAVPDTLFRTIGKLIEAEYVCRIKDLQTQFDEL